MRDKHDLIDHMNKVVRNNWLTGFLTIMVGQVFLVALHEMGGYPGIERVMSAMLGLVLGWMLGMSAIVLSVRYWLKEPPTKPFNMAGYEETIVPLPEGNEFDQMIRDGFAEAADYVDKERAAGYEDRCKGHVDRVGLDKDLEYYAEHGVTFGQMIRDRAAEDEDREITRRFNERISVNDE